VFAFHPLEFSVPPSLRERPKSAGDHAAVPLDGADVLSGALASLAHAEMQSAAEVKIHWPPQPLREAIYDALGESDHSYESSGVAGPARPTRTTIS
jgi:hypothetical protein